MGIGSNDYYYIGGEGDSVIYVRPLLSISKSSTIPLELGLVSMFSDGCDVTHMTHRDMLTYIVVGPF